MTKEEMIEQLENMILLIRQNGKDWLDERDIPILEEVIKIMKMKPCEDVISRQAVLNEIETVCFSKVWSKFRADNGSNGTRDYIINYIDQLPSVQPEPKTGKWNKIIDKFSIWREAWHYECSNCGNYISGYGKYKYCPECGTKMKEGEQGEIE